MRDQGHALSVGYFGLGIPVDSLVICSLNDVAQGRSANEIMCDFAMLQEVLEMNWLTSTITMSHCPCRPNCAAFWGTKAFDHITL